MPWHALKAQVKQEIKMTTISMFCEFVHHPTNSHTKPFCYVPKSFHYLNRKDNSIHSSLQEDKRHLWKKNRYASACWKNMRTWVKIPSTIHAPMTECGCNALTGGSRDWEDSAPSFQLVGVLVWITMDPLDSYIWMFGSLLVFRKGSEVQSCWWMMSLRLSLQQLL